MQIPILFFYAVVLLLGECRELPGNQAGWIPSWGQIWESCKLHNPLLGTEHEQGWKCSLGTLHLGELDCISLPEHGQLKAKAYLACF